MRTVAVEDSLAAPVRPSGENRKALVGHAHVNMDRTSLEKVEYTQFVFELEDVLRSIACNHSSLDVMPLRTEIEKALDELNSFEEGMRFQSLAIVLAKEKWPGF